MPSACEPHSPRVYVVLVNWNGWGHTLECLESLFRSDYPDYRVIVCDNRSDDGSVDHLEAWAEGRVDIAGGCRHQKLSRFSFPPAPKPIPYVVHGRGAAEAGSGGSDSSARLILIETGAQLGYAGGCNVGLRYALARDDFAYIWLLNNDTVVNADALSELVRRMRERPDAGICGSTLMYYHAPETIQALGGAQYNKWLGTRTPIGAHRPASMPVEVAEVEKKMSYVSGASMLVSRGFLHEIGLLCEDYFLYYEEIDWAARARPVCPGRRGWHWVGRKVADGCDGSPIGLASRTLAYEKNFVYLYEDLVDQMEARTALPYKRFPCVTPMWDNSPRRREGAYIFHGFTPELYERWLRNVLTRFQPPSREENLVFVNARNEWAEGNHLEPDQRWGMAYLEATKRAGAGMLQTWVRKTSYRGAAAPAVTREEADALS